MTTEDIINAIEQIQKSQSNIKIFTAVPMGIIMILFFFSFVTVYKDDSDFTQITSQAPAPVSFLVSELFQLHPSLASIRTR